MATPGGRREDVSFFKGDHHDGGCIISSIDTCLEARISGHLDHEGVELSFRHGTFPWVLSIMTPVRSAYPRTRQRRSQLLCSGSTGTERAGSGAHGTPPGYPCAGGLRDWWLHRGSPRGCLLGANPDPQHSGLPAPYLIAALVLDHSYWLSAVSHADALSGGPAAGHQDCA